MITVTEDKDGTVIASSKEFDVKIDSNRIVYVKDKRNSSLKNFSSIGMVGYGLTKDQKKNFVFQIHTKIQQRLEILDSIQDDNNVVNNNQQLIDSNQPNGNQGDPGASTSIFIDEPYYPPVPPPQRPVPRSRSTRQRRGGFVV